MANKKWKEDNVEKMREYRNNWYERNKEIEKVKARERRTLRRKELATWWEEYKKELSCEICGFSHPAAIDFHHIDPKGKDDNVATMVMSTSREVLLKEIEKCKILCSNCHRIEHYNQKNN